MTLVRHSIQCSIRLIQKLASYGFSGKLLLWLKGFLSDRYQRVVLNGSFSGWCAVTSGAPQGSVLGPLLFTLYINDIQNIVHTNLHFFVDDSNAYIFIASPNPDVHKQHLTLIFEHFKEFGVVINPAKCEFGVLQVTFLGHHVSGEGIQPLPDKIQTMQDFPQPITQRISWTS